MKNLAELENKIRNAIPELREEFEAFEDGSIDRDMITPIMLNHVLGYCDDMSDGYFYLREDGLFRNSSEFPPYQIEDFSLYWDLKSAYLKDQSEELINFLNQLK